MHLGIIKITYNRTATHFMDDSFVNLGEYGVPFVPKMGRLLCALYYTIVFVYSHCLLVQVNQYMLTCILSVDVVFLLTLSVVLLFFSLLILLSCLLSFGSVILCRHVI